MKLSQIIFLSLSVVFFIIGVHQTFVFGIIQSYWLFMLSVAMLLLYKLKQEKHDVRSEQPNQGQPIRQVKKKITTTKAKPRK